MDQEAPIKVSSRNAALQQTAVNIYPNYRDQVWYDLELGTEVFRTSKENWDFVLQPTGEILLNSSRAMFAGLSNTRFLVDKTDTLRIHFKYDVTSGNKDSTAFSNWSAANNFVEEQVYFVDMGFTIDNEHLGIKKLKITQNETDLQIAWMDLAEAGDSSIVMIDTKNEHPVYWSLEKGILEGTPSSSGWDIFFTQYIHVFYNEDPVAPYLVTGVLSNPNIVEIAEIDSTIGFENITQDIAKSSEPLKRIDVLGYNWKTYSYDFGSFSVDMKRLYVLKYKDGKILKFRFLDFYNDRGEKGMFTFEYQFL